MAAMGKRKMKTGQVKSPSRSKLPILDRVLDTTLKYPLRLDPLSIEIIPTSQINFSTTFTAGSSTMGGAIMREGFLTETGLIISTPLMSV